MFPLPNERGRFGVYGGRYVPETLIPALDELTRAYREAAEDADFKAELEHYLKTFVGRPSLLYFARNLTEHCGGAKIYLKREDLNHTGAHKVNNTVGQALLAKQMGKQRVIAETGAGQHGVATATAAALFGLTCVVYMGEEDVRRQALNVFRMKLLGAEVVTVTSGTRTLKDATNEAIRDWVTNVRDTFYIIGSVVGPHPYPMMVRDFQSVIGFETMETARGGRRKTSSRRSRGLRRRRLKRHRDFRALRVLACRGAASTRRRRGGGSRARDRRTRRQHFGRQKKACSTARSCT